MVDDKLTSLLTSAFDYMKRALTARENYYKGVYQAVTRARTEKHPNPGPTDAKMQFAKSLQGAQLIADNKWHMDQSRMFSAAVTARGTYLLLAEQRRTNTLLEENNRLQKEVLNAIRRGRDSG